MAPYGGYYYSNECYIVDNQYTLGGGAPLAPASMGGFGANGEMYGAGSGMGMPPPSTFSGSGSNYQGGSYGYGYGYMPHGYSFPPNGSV